MPLRFCGLLWSHLKSLLKYRFQSPAPETLNKHFWGEGGRKFACLTIYSDVAHLGPQRE